VPSCGVFSEADTAILDLAATAYLSARTAMDMQAIHIALAAIMGVVSEANRYFAGQEPWALRKTDFARMETVLFVTAEVLRQVAILVQPFIPESASKLLDALAVPRDQRDFRHLEKDHRLVSGSPMPAPQPIFPRYIEKSEDGQ
jgi:methionyl-tRNA synthetase